MVVGDGQSIASNITKFHDFHVIFFLLELFKHRGGHQVDIGSSVSPKDKYPPCFP